MEIPMDQDDTAPLTWCDCCRCGDHTTIMDKAVRRLWQDTAGGFQCRTSMCGILMYIGCCRLAHCAQQSHRGADLGASSVVSADQIPLTSVRFNTDAEFEQRREHRWGGIKRWCHI
jgi:hypothetical protein